MKVGGFNILDFLDRAEPVYGDRTGVVDEPDQPADSRGQPTWRQVDINQTMMDDQGDITKPEALVYELDANGEITGLVAHEYIVPIDAWTKSTPPQLFGMDFHKHPTLPLWVLHTWLWKDNPAGVFEDWNPAVRQYPDTVAIFGDDLPATTPPTTIADTPSG